MEKLQISINKVFNLWDFVVIYAVFVLNLCGEKLSPKVHVWRKNDKYEVCLINQVIMVREAII